MKTIDQAKKFLRGNFNKGIDCPCCGQTVKCYKRSITTTMAYGMIRMEPHNDFLKLCEFFRDEKNIPPSNFADISKLKYWGLAETSETKSDDGNHSGFWRLTEKGKMFVRNGLTVPKYALIYNKTFMGFDGENVNIQHALKNKFNYNELMGA